MTPKSAVLDFFSRNAKSPLPQDEGALLASFYLDVGIIDSLGIVMMIGEIEDKLGVTFSSEDMQSYEFQTVGGLIGIVERLVAEKA